MLLLFFGSPVGATVDDESPKFENGTAAFAAGALSAVSIVAMKQGDPSRLIGALTFGVGTYVAVRDEGEFAIGLGAMTATLGLVNLLNWRDTERNHEGVSCSLAPGAHDGVLEVSFAVRKLW